MHKWLLEGEQVEICCRPHSRILVWPITVGLLVILLGSAALAKLQPGPFSHWAPGMEPWREPALVLLVVAGGLTLLLYPVRRVWRWAWTRYFLTSQRLLVRRGPFGRFIAIHSMEQIQEVRPVQKWRQKMAGSGDLQLHMYRGPIRTLAEVPALTRFNKETQQAWIKVFRTSVASIQQTPQPGDYASEVGMREKGLRKLGRDH
ncbi:hypothetical protein ART_4093 [Arthrobacter sp. PAMC 25486]|uniref:PH domain-containing protein n=1 Tax=Arthrobacter sp. PAMC 25486 TaxID=1494608 RepID=UPI0005360FED|nr:PH domain-containing protein [Arthrobacter sp. PAMC 25486]AIY03692.1 hypothetical protein ART_4093 [Arthrobacter sp. PAMC 25486]